MILLMVPWPVWMEKLLMVKRTTWVFARLTNACPRSGHTRKRRKSLLSLLLFFQCFWFLSSSSWRTRTTYDTRMPTQAPLKLRFWKPKTKQAPRHLAVTTLKATRQNQCVILDFKSKWMNTNVSPNSFIRYLFVTLFFCPSAVAH